MPPLGSLGMRVIISRAAHLLPNEAGIDERDVGQLSRGAVSEELDERSHDRGVLGAPQPKKWSVVEVVLSGQSLGRQTIPDSRQGTDGQRAVQPIGDRCVLVDAVWIGAGRIRRSNGRI